jgi:hypothetical protein
MHDNDLSHTRNFSLLHNMAKCSVPIQHIFTPIKMQLVVVVHSPFFLLLAREFVSLSISRQIACCGFGCLFLLYDFESGRDVVVLFSVKKLTIRMCGFGTLLDH